MKNIFQAFLTEKFETIVETVKTGAPADTQILGRFDHMEELVQAKAKEINERFDRQHESDTAKDEKLDRMDKRLNELASLLAICTTNVHQTAPTGITMESLVVRMDALETKNGEL